MIIVENDVLRDEGEVYVKKLNVVGVKVIVMRYVGIIYDFVMLNFIVYILVVRVVIK